MDEAKLREQIATSLSGRGAHVPFEKAVADFPLELAGRRVPGLAHGPWEILYHLWIAQWDILEFVRDPSHKSPAWPQGYWPKEQAPESASQWHGTVKKFREDLDSMIGLVRDPANDLLAPFPHGEGQTLLREALLIIDHNSYHVGQLVDVRRSLNAWPQ